MDLNPSWARWMAIWRRRKQQLTDLTSDQTRLRQNIDSLNRVKGQEDQVRQYAGQLSENEGRLEKLRDQQRDLTSRGTNFGSELNHAIEQLDF